MKSFLVKQPKKRIYTHLKDIHSEFLNIFVFTLSFCGWRRESPYSHSKTKMSRYVVSAVEIWRTYLFTLTLIPRLLSPVSKKIQSESFHFVYFQEKTQPPLPSVPSTATTKFNLMETLPSYWCPDAVFRWRFLNYQPNFPSSSIFPTEHLCE